MSNYISAEKKKQIFHLLCEGNGVRSVSRVVGVSTNTITGLQIWYSQIVDFLNRRYIKELVIDNIEADEIRTFVYRKNNVKWVYIALDRSSRLIVHFHIGKRDAKDAKIFLIGLSDKLISTSKVSTDCLKSYCAAVEKTPLGYIPDEVNSIDMLRARCFGELPWHITNRIETHNGNVRQHVSKLTRRTRCFSKSDDGLKRHLMLFFFYYNFIKKHSSLKTSPIVKAGLLEEPLSLDYLVSIDKMFMEQRDNRRGEMIKREIENRVKAKEDMKLMLQELNDVSFYEGNPNVNKKLRVVA